MLSMLLSSFFNLICVVVVAHYPLTKILEVIAPAMLAAFLTSLVYIYYKEIDDREAFLNEMDQQSWNLLPDDILFDEFIGKFYSMK